MWPTYVMPLVYAIGPRAFLIVSGCLTHTVVALGSLLFFLPSYLGLCSWLDQYRIDVLRDVM